MRYMVYQRRMTVDALKTKALLLASLDPERASKAAQDYFECAIPVDDKSREDRQRDRERELEQIANAEPIHMSQIKTGAALTGSQQWGTSMHRR
jgi:hypothetical protein